jgi:2-polyprenyl-3-methyl-5-hydroxy-6-metoxy-1,4-benzoquinol methylase
MTQRVPAGTLAEMTAYYRARAAEYDEWFYRQGRYDRGADANARWLAEAETVFAAIDRLSLTGDILELAPGTGIWTERLARTARSVTAVDASAEMIAINRAKVGRENVTYLLADLFTWQPDRTYDAVVFGFWISHVPHERLTAFLAMTAAALRPDGAIFFVDGRREPTSTAAGDRLPEADSQMMTRRLNDGRTFQIVKNFYAPADLAAHCAAAGLDVAMRETPTYFQYGSGTRK